ncbi:MAG: hypothetical protein H6553_03000 [Chitinophagales bacterium]|nr:hypothetical protein [Chitinophagales bacterium]
MACNYSNDYLFGFNGMERDDEIKGQGNSYDFGARIYDSRLGKFMSIDPLTSKYPYYSPYLFAGNKPIMAIDNEGKEENYLNAVKNSVEKSAALQQFKQDSPNKGVPHAPENSNFDLNLSFGSDFNKSLVKSANIEYNPSTGNVSSSASFTNKPEIGIKQDLTTINFGVKSSAPPVVKKQELPPLPMYANQTDALSIYKIPPPVELSSNNAKTTSTSFDVILASSSESVTTIKEIVYPKQYSGAPYANAPVGPKAILNTYQITQTESSVGAGVFSIGYGTYDVVKNGGNIGSWDRGSFSLGLDKGVGGKKSPFKAGASGTVRTNYIKK